MIRPEFEHRLRAAMTGTYDTWSMLSDAIWSTLRERSEPEQVQLMRILLTDFRLVPPDPERNGPQPAGIQLAPETYSALVEQLVHGLHRFIEAVLFDNQEVLVVAGRVVRYFAELADEEERQVALALLLQSSLVPYVQMPANLMAAALTQGPDLEEVGKRPEVRQAFALLDRITEEAPTPAALAVGFMRIAARGLDGPATTAVLTRLIYTVAVRTHRDAMLSALSSGGSPMPVIAVRAARPGAAADDPIAAAWPKPSGGGRGNPQA